MPVKGPKRKYRERPIDIGDRVVLASGSRAGMTGHVLAFKQDQAYPRDRLASGELEPLGPKHMGPLFAVVILEYKQIQTISLPADLRLLAEGVLPRRVKFP